MGRVRLINKKKTKYKYKTLLYIFRNKMRTLSGGHKSGNSLLISQQQNSPQASITTPITIAPSVVSSFILYGALKSGGKNAICLPQKAKINVFLTFFLKKVSSKALEEQRKSFRKR